MQATNVMPKELVPIVDKPLIQHAALRAIAAGIYTLIFVIGRNVRGIEDHFDSTRSAAFYAQNRASRYGA